MASSNIARLGIVFGVDTAELEVKIAKAKETFHGFTKQVERDSNNAAKDLVALRHATEDYGKTLTKVEQIEREIKAGRYQRAEGSMVEMLRKEAAAYDAKANAIKNAAGAQFKMNEQQKIQLTYQTTDFFTQIASGQSPFLAAFQQGGQLKDVMGGVGNAFRAVGSIFTPFRVGVLAVATAFGTVSYALYKAIDDLDKFKDAMTLTGGFAGVTYDKLLNLGNVLSTKTNASIGDARDLMQQLAASGKFTATSMEAVGEVVLRFSKIADVDAKKAAETLIPLLDGTASSAKQLNDKYHFLTLEQYKNIEALEKQGKLQESIKLQATLFNESLASTQRQLGNLESAWEGVRNFASKAWDAMMGWGRENGTERAKELEKLINETIAEVERRQSKGLKTGSQEAALSAFRTELNAIVSKEMAALDAAEAKAKKAEENAKKIKAYSGAGGSTKESEIKNAIAKAEAEVRFLESVKLANEIQKVELETAKKIEEKKLEFSKKTSEEKMAFGGLLAKQEAAEIQAIQLASQEKIKQIQIKKYMEAQEIKIAYQKEMDDDFVRRSQARIAADMTALSNTEQLDLQRKSLDLKFQMIYATEREQKLAQISLKYARERELLERREDKSDYQRQQIDRQEAMAQMFVVMEESMMRTQQVFDTVFGSLSASIDNFVRTGKLSFKDLTRSVIQNMLAMEMKLQAMKLLRGLFASFGGTASTYNASGGIAEHVFNPQARAMGGPVSAGSPYIVGERGPELFMPSGSGTIIPNHQMSNGSTTNVTNNYINAIDTKSFEDRLLGSSNAIWAANQYANKNLATNFGRT